MKKVLLLVAVLIGISLVGCEKDETKPRNLGNVVNDGIK